MSHETLTLILPVHDAQQMLSHQVATALEVAAELTAHFEVVVVDDGSTDDTEEIARELAVRYPQLQVARHRRRRGEEATLRTGMMTSYGDIVIVQSLNSPVQPAEIRRLWRDGRGEEGEAARQRHGQTQDAGMISRLMAWGQTVQKAQRAQQRRAQLFRRSELQQQAAPRFLPNRVDGAARGLPAASPNFLSHVRNFALGE